MGAFTHMKKEQREGVRLLVLGFDYPVKQHLRTKLKERYWRGKKERKKKKNITEGKRASVKRKRIEGGRQTYANRTKRQGKRKKGGKKENE